MQPAPVINAALAVRNVVIRLEIFPIYQAGQFSDARDHVAVFVSGAQVADDVAKWNGADHGAKGSGRLGAEEQIEAHSVDPASRSLFISLGSYQAKLST